jgi:hypothetical protein
MLDESRRVRHWRDPYSGVLAVENEPGQIDVYRLPGLEKTDPLVFPSPIAVATFSADGRRLFVLTANQTAYILDTAKLLGPPVARAAQAQ